MYTRQEVTQQKQAFWTAFGKYMQPIPGADSEKLNWVNYKTGIQGISFRMDADNKEASIAIVLSHADTAIRQRHYAQLSQLKSMLEEQAGEAWVWQPEATDEHGKITSQVSTKLQGVNVLNPQDWPQLISFLKPRIMALDAFWSMVKYGFEV